MERKKILKYGTVLGLLFGSLASSYKIGEMKGYRKGLETVDSEIDKIARRWVNYSVENLIIKEGEAVTGEKLHYLDIPNYDYCAIANIIKKKALKRLDEDHIGAALENMRIAGQLRAYCESQRIIRFEKGAAE